MIFGVRIIVEKRGEIEEAVAADEDGPPVLCFEKDFGARLDLVAPFEDMPPPLIGTGA